MITKLMKCKICGTDTVTIYLCPRCNYNFCDNHVIKLDKYNSICYNCLKKLLNLYPIIKIESLCSYLDVDFNSMLKILNQFKQKFDIDIINFNNEYLITKQNSLFKKLEHYICDGYIKITELKIEPQILESYLSFKGIKYAKNNDMILTKNYIIKKISALISKFNGRFDVSLLKDIGINLNLTDLKEYIQPPIYLVKNTIISFGYIINFLINNIKVKKEIVLNDLGKELNLDLSLSNEKLLEDLKNIEIDDYLDKFIITQDKIYSTEYFLKRITKLLISHKIIPISELKFNLEEEIMLNILNSLIQIGLLDAKLDSENKVLIENDTGRTDIERNGIPKDELLVKRIYYFEGELVHFKIEIYNKSTLPLIKLKILIDFDTESFKTDNNLQTSLILNPKESKSFDFYLKPLKCGISKISPIIIYNINNISHIYQVPPKEIQINRLEKPKTISSFDDIKEIVKTMQLDLKVLLIKDLNLPKDLIASIIQTVMNFLGLNCIQSNIESNIMNLWWITTSKTEKIIVINIIITEEFIKLKLFYDNRSEIAQLLSRIMELIRNQMEILNNSLKKLNTDSKSVIKTKIELMELIITTHDMIFLQFPIQDIKDNIIMILDKLKKINLNYDSNLSKFLTQNNDFNYNELETELLKLKNILKS